MTHDPKALQAILSEAAPPDLALVFKPMFGGILAYAHEIGRASCRERVLVAV